ncbi:MAG TPA: von Willebrand factor type A domain-containing protein, partial [Sediminibacterium sp.]|nr:von Willebrand factor type A domain-containing protein [Sediminibacterium sp.]
MKSFVCLFCLGFAVPVQAQYYLRGEVRDEQGILLQGVRITLDSKGSAPYYSGSAGTFGIPLHQPTDSMTLSLEGFETLRSKTDARQYQHYILKRLATTELLHPGKRNSLTTNLPVNYIFNPALMGESYHSLVENPFIEADRYPETGFAISVDKASYSNVRRFLNNEMRVPPDAVRIEEMLNYFDFSAAFPHKRTQFLCKTQFSSCPWNPANKLLFVRIAAPMLQLDSLPPSNLVFLIDISGSMDRPNRLPLLQSAFKLLADNLRSVDTLSIVTYGGGVGIALPPTSGDRKETIIQVIDSLTASGDTPGENAIRIAYQLAKRSFQPKGNNRVILATDGDFNVGESSEKELENLISSYRETGIYLTCLGVGMGNYKDSKLETLAKKGNGNFAYLDNMEEAQKVLVKEFTQTMYA